MPRMPAMHTIYQHLLYHSTGPITIARMKLYSFDSIFSLHVTLIANLRHFTIVELNNIKMGWHDVIFAIMSAESSCKGLIIPIDNF